MAYITLVQFWVSNGNILIIFDTFNESLYKLTHVRIDKVIERPEDPFSRICEGICPWLKPEGFD